MLPILINYKVIHHTLAYWEIILSIIIPKHIAYSPTCLTLETDDKHRYWQWQTQYCWGRLLLCPSGCGQLIWSVDIDINWPYQLSIPTQHWYGQLSWKTRAGVSMDVYKKLECVTKTDSMFSNRVWMTPKSTSINEVTIWLEQLDLPQ